METLNRYLSHFHTYSTIPNFMYFSSCTGYARWCIQILLCTWYDCRHKVSCQSIVRALSSVWSCCKCAHTHHSEHNPILSIIVFVHAKWRTLRSNEFFFFLEIPLIRMSNEASIVHGYTFWKETGLLPRKSVLFLSPVRVIKLFSSVSF